MDIVEVNKVLSNEVRVNILQWLKDPEGNFSAFKDQTHLNDGVCVQYIGDKAGLSQSTISHYLSMMQRVGLIIPTRHGKWTYYQRNEKQIKAYLDLMRKNL